ncbi:MAG: 2OG-FeII oxygenase [Edafosvirus sp.]|uniref:2OG-FeII oxygenase n=1 Tax=Edafosvirus sp. TaxID=2487765 RepID=A0A3G4ZUZ2_9VIRU|nr:MAG: 2OG-FeII oxygenase [Edafosvirus sp.]
MNKVQKDNFVLRPAHKKDDGHAHIKFGEDPKPNLQKYGYCVVEDVFDEKFCKSIIDQMWSWLKGLDTKIRRNDPKSWSDDRWPVYLKSGMLQHTMGQNETFAWPTREHDNVIKIFTQIHGTDKLLTSFDGCSINRPISSGFTKDTPPGGTQSWLHTDENVIRDINVEDVYTSAKYSVQGVANFENVGDNDGSLFVGESSHLLHRQLFEWNGNEPKNNWYVLKKDDIEFLKKKGTVFIKVNAPAGSLILFDSRCFHSGCTSVGKDNNTFRYVIYVSQSPASRTTKADLELKKKAVQTGFATSHWSSCNIKIFPLPRGKHQPYMTRKENIPDYEKN